MPRNSLKEYISQEDVNIVLNDLYFTGGGNIQDVSYSTGIPEDKVKIILNSAYRMGLVVEESRATDARFTEYKHFYLTPKGQELLGHSK